MIRKGITFDFMRECFEKNEYTGDETPLLFFEKEILKKENENLTIKDLKKKIDFENLKIIESKPQRNFKDDLFSTIKQFGNFSNKRAILILTEAENASDSTTKSLLKVIDRAELLTDFTLVLLNVYNFDSFGRDDIVKGRVF